MLQIIFKEKKKRIKYVAKERHQLDGMGSNT